MDDFFLKVGCRRVMSMDQTGWMKNVSWYWGPLSFFFISWIRKEKSNAKRIGVKKIRLVTGGDYLMITGEAKEFNRMNNAYELVPYHKSFGKFLDGAPWFLSKWVPPVVEQEEEVDHVTNNTDPYSQAAKIINDKPQQDIMTNLAVLADKIRENAKKQVEAEQKKNAE